MLVLGTAAFGFPYGIANKVGKMDRNQVLEMVRTAWFWGINEFDTAQMYQNSEEYLGRAFEALGIQDHVKVVTKLHPDLNYRDRFEVYKSVEESIKKLNVKKLYGILLHRESMLDDQIILDTLHGLKEMGLTEKVGVSVYYPEYALKALRRTSIDIIQFPSCILDRRFERANIFELAKRRGKEIYLRNIFLQGLLLADSKECLIPAVKVEIEKFERWVTNTGLSRCEFAVGYLIGIAPEAKLIFGAETPEQIRECTEASRWPFPEDLIEKVKQVFSKVDNNRVLIPKNWRKDENIINKSDS